MRGERGSAGSGLSVVERARLDEKPFSRVFDFAVAAVIAAGLAIQAFATWNRSLLSDEALVQTNPQLEINADDVKCNHGSTVGQIDPDQLFYLRARGLDQEVASRLVVEGFLAELVERFEEGPVREALATALERRLADVLG